MLAYNPVAQFPVPLMTSDLVKYLAGLEPGRYDSVATNVLCAVSAWAYSSEETLRRMLLQRGLPSAELVSVELTNDALFLDTTASLIRYGEVGILCFRGTGPTNLIDWMTDLSVEPDPFQAIGYVHGGIYRGVLSLWPRIRRLLMAALEGRSFDEVRLVDVGKTSATRGVEFDDVLRFAAKLILLREHLPNDPAFHSFEHLLRPEEMLRFSARFLLGEELTREESNLLQMLRERENEAIPELQALYITGHSLGGALAALAAVLLDQDPKLRELVNGVYTFGQPMVGDPTFASECDKAIGSKVFRHVYKRDVVPRLPPITAGRFKHFGREYTSTSTGWMYRSAPLNQAFSFLVSTAIGGVSAVLQQFPLLRGIRMPFSWGDHSPLNYLRTSQMTPPGVELNPWLSRPHE